MAEPEKADNKLRSWKEIAAHLRVDERTCARWEKNFGLPVHRAQGEGKKSRVLAYRDELDAWLQTTFRNHQKGANATARPPRGRRIWLWSLPILAAVIIGALVLILPKWPERDLSDRVPADFRIEGSVLVILDGAGEPLGSYDTGLPNLWSEKEYKDISISSNRPLGLLYVLIRDIQGDGRQEVLFATQTRDELSEGDLICLNAKGDELWKFHSGRELPFGTKTYSPDYRISCLDASDLDGDGRMEIFLASQHYPEWPCQISLLSSDGISLGEYWNSGSVNDMVAVDLDADGRKEIVGAGLNNEYRKACVIALGGAGFRGASPNSGEFRSAEFPTGGHIAYILLPRTEIDRMEYPYEGPEDIRLLANGNFQVFTHISRLFFEFRPDLTLQHVLSSHAFELLHQKYYSAGKVPKPYSEQEYIKPLEKEVLYFDGQGWTTTPTTKLKPIH
ncbi:MAG: VCBS repeat-containing protein [Candidatus Aminicenantes bacterium]|nr:VCBS repeat-containing protein [Candidatus Aminicenantes bacterium]